MNKEHLLISLAEVLMMTPAGVLVTVALFRRGFLRRSALDQAPPRGVELGLFDLAVTVIIFVVGIHVLGRLLMDPGGGAARARVAATQGSVEAPPATAPAPRAASSRHVAVRALLGQSCTQVPMVLWVLWRVGRQPRGLHQFGAVPHRPWWELRAGFLGAIAAMLVSLSATVLFVRGASLFGHESPEVGHEMLRAMRRSPSAHVVASLVFSAVILAPLLEEVLFRGLIQTVLVRLIEQARRNRALAPPPALDAGPLSRLADQVSARFAGLGRWSVVLIASCIFTFIHFSAVPWQLLPSLLVLSLVLGWLYERSGSLWPSVMVHMGFNAVNTALVLLGPVAG